MTTVRPAVLAGAWYPGRPDRLRDEVDGYLAGADPEQLPPGAPAVALVPHAGYAHSGPTAGKLYGLLRDLTLDAVFILAPSHRSALQRPALPGVDAFATPLGDIAVDTAIVRRLLETGHYVVDDQAHAAEHAVEIQLPFVQRAWPATPVVPVLVPPLAPAERHAAARALDPWRDDRHLLVVSSDLTHYGHAYGYVPFTDDVPGQLESLDSGALLRFLARDADGLLQYREETGITMCGLDAAALALDGETGDHHAELLDYARSSVREHGGAMSVSYAAALLTRGDGGAAGLTRDEQMLLLALARRSVAAAAADGPSPAPEAVAHELGLELSGALREPRGAFVTLTASGHLRGCIGSIVSDEPLAETVVASAASAAVADPRFPAVRPDEVASLMIEVSALTPPRAVAGPDGIEIGRHGILLSRGPHRAVFLPQVASEQGWDLPTTLAHLARKAGLSPDAWRAGCRFEVFEAEICKE